MSTKSKKIAQKLQIVPGCMIGRMHLLRTCVDKEKSPEQTLEIVRKKYPYGLTGSRAISWITREIAKYKTRLARRTQIIPDTKNVVATKKTRKSRKIVVASPGTSPDVAQSVVVASPDTQSVVETSTQSA